jgi:hypothetical protein
LHGHDGLCQFWKSRITPAMRVMLENPPDPRGGTFAWARARSPAFRALRARGLLTEIHKREGGTYVVDRVKVTKRGQALLDGQDVR